MRPGQGDRDTCITPGDAGQRVSNHDAPTGDGRSPARKGTVTGQEGDAHRPDAGGQPRLRARISTTLPASFGARRSLAATSGTEMAAALGAALPLTEDMAR